MIGGWRAYNITTELVTGVGAWSDEELIEYLRAGHGSAGGPMAEVADGVLMMPAFGAAYSDIEIAGVANYVTARFGAAPSHLTAKEIAEYRRVSSP